MGATISPMREDFFLSPAKLCVPNPFDANQRATSKTNILKNLVYFQTNYVLMFLITQCLTILSILINDFIGGKTGFTLNASIVCIIAYLCCTSQMQSSLSITILLGVLPLLSTALYKSTSLWYLVYLNLWGIPVSMCSVFLHAYVRCPDFTINVNVGAEYFGVTRHSVLFAVQKSVNVKTLFTLTVSTISVLYFIYSFYTILILVLLFVVLIIIFTYLYTRR